MGTDDGIIWVIPISIYQILMEEQTSAQVTGTCVLFQPVRAGPVTPEIMIGGQ
jgi:hypothetical protein